MVSQIFTIVISVLFGAVLYAQPPQRVSKEHLEDLLDRIEENTNEFKESLEDALDESAIDGSRHDLDPRRVGRHLSAEGAVAAAL